MAELREYAGAAEVGTADNAGISSADIEMGDVAPDSGTSPTMRAFMDETEETKRLMAVISANIRQIEQAHGECLTAVSTEQGRTATDKLQGLMSSTNATATQVVCAFHVTARQPAPFAACAQS